MSTYQRINKRGLGEIISYPPRRKKSHLIIVPGLLGTKEDSQPYLADILSKEFTVSLMQLPEKGFVSKKPLLTSIRSMARYVQQHSKRNPVYIAHGLANAVVATAVNNYALQIKGMYGIAPYPGSDSLTGIRTLGRLLAEDFAMQAVSLESELKTTRMQAIPKRFVYGDADFFTGANDYKTRLHFRHFLRKACEDKNISSWCFANKNYSFNNGVLDGKTFNKSEPLALIDDIRGFVQNLYK
jgi:hypothetical protein